ncbi:MAG: fused MFS/spermidine synthase [Sedimentisphaerales bacterium]|nr:fused MFS/spermidine synthase [Sedimentisphaerales bacterium]
MNITNISDTKMPVNKSLLIFFALTVFCGAFLLFVVQPIMGRFILPWFGGTPAVWTTCMLLFQLLLLAGYLYAHLLTCFFRPYLQVFIHCALALLCLFSLPALPQSSPVSQAGSQPVLSILILLTLAVGGPYMLLAATGPLMQSWFGLCMPGKSPFRLYALSNTGSLLALLGYPFLIEPFTGRLTQIYNWSWLMAGFIALIVLCGLMVLAHLKKTPLLLSAHPHARHNNSKVPALTIFFWLAFPAVASVELLAITSRITQDIAAIPFLWILPLSIYLLTFIICFDSPRWYYHSFYLFLLIISIVFTIWLQLHFADCGIMIQIISYCALLFACCMVCHGQLYLLRPQTGPVTGYYLFIATGGCLGGIFVAIVAPLIFKTDLELNLGLLCGILLTILADIQNRIPFRRRIAWTLIIAAISLTFIFTAKPVGIGNRSAVLFSRNFFGTLTLWLADEGTADQRLILQHGTTFHGIQFTDPAKRKTPAAYYGYRSGAGLAFNALEQKQNRKIGVIGLGVGTVATYSRPGDIFAFYEINPAVIALAANAQWFTFLRDFAGSHYDTYLGDARLVLAGQQQQAFDLLIIDAFSSDSVPVHLLTKEALEIYQQHLAPDGIMAFHLSNNHLDLPALVLALAADAGLNCLWVADDGDESGTFTSNWVLLCSDASVIATPAIKAQSVNHKPRQVTPWTDDRVNLLEILVK